MALFVDTTGFLLEAEVDIAAGAGPDAGNVSDTPVPGDPTAVRIVFTQSTSGFGQNRLNALVNTIPNFIVVTGVNSSFVVNGVLISTRAGLTFVDAAGIIRIVYDVTQCAGSNYFVFDAGGNQIGFPNSVLVGHELAHAFHISIGDLPATVAAAESQAITDENGYRGQFGLTLRDPNNTAGGCGLPAGPGPSPPPTCLIASAAYGSPHASQLNNARRLRDLVLRRSAWGAEFFDKMHYEYYRFSPQVADTMNRQPAVRQAIWVLTVEPFFQFLGILEAYVRHGRGVAPVAQATLRRFAAELPNAGIQAEQARAIFLAFSNLKARLQPTMDGDDAADPVFASEDGADAAGILASLSAIIEAAVPADGYVSWALLDPLILFWKAVSQCDGPGSQFLQEIDEWLCSTPIPSCYSLLDEQAVEDDLRYLRDIWFTSPEVRETVGKRLSKSLDGGVSCDISSVLKRTGYESAY